MECNVLACPSKPHTESSLPQGPEIPVLIHFLALSLLPQLLIFKGHLIPEEIALDSTSSYCPSGKERVRSFGTQSHGERCGQAV